MHAALEFLPGDLVIMDSVFAVPTEKMTIVAIVLGGCSTASSVFSNQYAVYDLLWGDRIFRIRETDKGFLSYKNNSPFNHPHYWRIREIISCQLKT